MLRLAAVTILVACLVAGDARSAALTTFAVEPRIEAGPAATDALRVASRSHGLGHEAARIAEWHPAVPDTPWLEIRRNEAYPAFTSASIDGRYPGLDDGTSADRIGRYFLAAGFALSCLGFMVFLSFFRELLPLPMFGSPVVDIPGQPESCRVGLSIGKNAGRHESYVPRTPTKPSDFTALARWWIGGRGGRVRAA